LRPVPGPPQARSTPLQQEIIPVLKFLTDTVASNGYLALFVMMAIGSACIPIPAEIVLAFGGALASSGFAAKALHDPSKQLTFWTVVAVGIAGAMVGSWVAYAAGYAGGRPLVDRWGRYLLLRPHEVDRAHEWFERRGEAAVFLARLVPVIRGLISLPAGVARMPFWRFTLFSFLGQIPFAIGFTLSGYLLGQRWGLVERYFRPISIALAVLVIAGIAWWFVRRSRTRRHRGATPEPGVPARRP
jgi:membrane protein DedA with SNARE-associated domain